MPKPRKKELHTCRFFSWKIGRRGGIYFADGRAGNPFNLGRHSLGTRDYHEAIENLKDLDERIAVERGLVQHEELERRTSPSISLVDGWDLYTQHVSRPRVAGGAKPKTLKRYRAVRDKFNRYAENSGVRNWNSVNRDLLVRYGSWLDGESYAYRTQYLELTTLKQCLKWLRQAGHLPDVGPLLDLPLRKPTGTDTYCYRKDEVQAMVEQCFKNPHLVWLGEVIMALATTGLRISELASLRWSDIDLAENLIVLADESTRAPHKLRSLRRQTKSSRSRSFPIHSELRHLLERKRQSKDSALFRGPLGGALKGDTVRNVLVREVIKPLMKRFPNPPGELGFADGRLHSLRHYFCSTCANCGVPELVVMRWLGHSDSAMVKLYYHLHDREAQRFMEQIEFVGNTGGTVPSVIEEEEGARAAEVA